MFVTALVWSLAITALAASGQVSFNMSAVHFNGTQISAAGEDYTLSNGAKAPSSITYTDEQGGGTTYLPVRRISELMGVEIGYDANNGAVTISGDADTTTTTEENTQAPSADYSNWTAEEEAAYQEFKGMWEIKFRGSGDVKYSMNGSYENTPWEAYTLIGSLTYIETYNVLEKANQQGFLNRLAHELKPCDIMIELYFISKEGATMPYTIK